MNKQNKTLRPIAFALAALIATFVVPAASNAQVLYSQNFNNISGSTAYISTVGWNGYLGAGAVDVSSTAKNATYYGNSAITVPGVGGVANPPAGYLQFYNEPLSGSTMSESAVKTGLNLALTSGTSTITWKMNTSAAASQELRLLIQVDGAWYVSSSSFSQTVLSAPSGASCMNTVDTASLVYSTDKSMWSSFTLNGSADNTGTMAIGSALTSDLTSSAITGIGFYTVMGNKYSALRIDSLEVNAVPEPATAGLLLIGSIGVLCAGMRKRM